MSDIKPWYPNLEKSKEFQEHRNPLGDTPQIKVPDPEEDTAPLRGSKDLSDDDSLEDVIAATYSPHDDESADPIEPDPSKL